VDRHDGRKRWMIKLLEILLNEILNLLKFMQDLLFKIPQKEVYEEVINEQHIDMEKQPVIEEINNQPIVEDQIQNVNDFFSKDKSTEGKKRACRVINDIYKTRGIDLCARYPNVNCPIEVLKLGVEEGVISVIEIAIILQKVEAGFIVNIFDKVIQATEYIFASQERIGNKVDNITADIVEMRQDNKSLFEKIDTQNEKMDFLTNFLMARKQQQGMTGVRSAL
jgi:hypothetical protein